MQINTFSGIGVAVAGALALLGLPAMGSVTTIPDSALTPSTSLYTNTFGNIVVMTGGGNAPGVGDPTGRNDDGFSGPIDLGFTLNFFGTNYTQFYINNNGNVSFGNGISEYVPSGPTGADQPIISPFFSDVDTRGANSGVVHVSQLPNEDIVTWDHVGYYNSHDDKLDTFQLVLRGPGYSVPSGEGQIGFFYTSMQWEAADTDGGTGGLCTPGESCQPGAIGFGDGLGSGEILASSLNPGVNGVVNNEHVWFDVSSGGVPVTPTSGVPEPSSYGLLAAGMLGLGFACKKFKLHRQ